MTEAIDRGDACDSETLSAISASSGIVADAGVAPSTAWTSGRNFPRKAWRKKPSSNLESPIGEAEMEFGLLAQRRSSRPYTVGCLTVQ